MSRLLMLVEGPTERAVVQKVFAPALGERGIYVFPRVVGKPGHKGGNKFASVLNELMSLIKQEPSSTVTTFFDYYGLHNDWPDIEKAKGKPPTQIPSILETAIEARIKNEFGNTYRSDRFIPYIQMHELESLLFAGTAEMASIFKSPALQSQFNDIVTKCGGCENINDNPQKSPSKRIMELFPQYKKGSSVNAHAWQITNRIGLNRIREKCPHFNEWMNKLEQIAN